MNLLGRLPLRLRVTLGFGLVMAALLAATGLMVFVLVRARVDRTVDHGLRSRAADMSALVEQADSGLREARGRPAALDLAQILDTRGRVLDSSPGTPRRSLLPPAVLARARLHTTTIARADMESLEGSARLLATPVHAQDRQLIVVVGAPLAERDRTLADLAAVLLIGMPLALLLACLAGYGLVTAAMRPVDAMRREAEAISTERLDRRLPLSRAHDELHRLGATLNAMLDRLTAGLARERAFTADASHELRTPLTLLRTRLELMADTRPTGDELDRVTGEALADAERLQTLLDDLLALARLESDRFGIHPRDVAAADLLGRTAERYRLLDEETEVHVDADADVVVHADADRIEQALGNMVDNALRHGRPPIELAAEALDGHVRLHVRDRGGGFADAFVGQAFERFARGATATGDGAGLGLAIVHLIARSHGGRAGADNRPGGGADVWIELDGGGGPAAGRSGGRHVPGATIAPET